MSLDVRRLSGCLGLGFVEALLGSLGISQSWSQECLEIELDRKMYRHIMHLHLSWRMQSLFYYCLAIYTNENSIRSRP